MSETQFMPRGCTKRPEKPFRIVEIRVASEGISQIKLNENACHVLTKEPDRSKQLIDGIRPQKPFRTASSTTATLRSGRMLLRGEAHDHRSTNRKPG